MSKKPVASQILSTIEEYGWWKDLPADQEEGPGGQCIVTARYQFEDENGPGTAAVADAYDTIEGVIREFYPDGPWIAEEGRATITHWNDAPQTKITHVRKVLREAARRERNA